jgi:hypothetical protein
MLEVAALAMKNVLMNISNNGPAAGNSVVAKTVCSGFHIRVSIYF